MPAVGHNGVVEEMRARVREAVVARDGQLSPIQLIRQLTNEGLKDDRVRVALWQLLGRGELELTADWKLRMASETSVTSASR